MGRSCWRKTKNLGLKDTALLDLPFFLPIAHVLVHYLHCPCVLDLQEQLEGRKVYLSSFFQRGQSTMMEGA